MPSLGCSHWHSSCRSCEVVGFLDRFSNGRPFGHQDSKNIKIVRIFRINNLNSKENGALKNDTANLKVISHLAAKHRKGTLHKNSQRCLEIQIRRSRDTLSPLSLSPVRLFLMQTCRNLQTIRLNLYESLKHLDPKKKKMHGCPQLNLVCRTLSGKWLKNLYCHSAEPRLQRPTPPPPNNRKNG